MIAPLLEMNRAVEQSGGALNDERWTETLRFLREPYVLFNNNLAKRDLWMAEDFRPFHSDEDAHELCLMRSVISTIQK
jgi:hypothetical protein